MRSFINLRQAHATLLHAMATIGHTLQSSPARNAIVYIIGSFALRSITLVLAPFFMRTLSPADYGKLSLMTTFVLFGSCILGLGLRQYLSIEYFQHQPLERKKLVGNILFLYIFIALPITCLALMWRTTIFSWLFAHGIGDAALCIALCMTTATFFTELVYQIMQYEGQAKALTLLQLIVACMVGMLSFWLVCIMQVGYQGMLIAQTCGLTTIALIGFLYHLPETVILPCISRDTFAHWTHIITNSFPFIPSMIFVWIVASSNRYVLAHYASLHDVGIYAVADIFSQLFYSCIIYPWSGSYHPYIMKQLCEHRANPITIEQHNERIMYFTMCTIALLSIVGYFIAYPVMARIVPKAYHEALRHVVVIIGGQIFLLGGYFGACFIQLHRRNLFLATSLALPAITNILLSIILIPTWGIAGCTNATLISYMLYFAHIMRYNYALRRQYHHLPL